MLSFGNARHKVERWLRGRETAPSASSRSQVHQDEAASNSSENHDDHVRHFLEELEASSQQWLGRVRIINLETIRERVGPAWIKLQNRVELLAEKLISEEMTSRDRFVK